MPTSPRRPPAKKERAADTTVGPENGARLGDVPPPAEAEAEALGGINKARAAFKAAADREKGRLEDALDSEYWVAVCFQTHEQKEEFLRKMGWRDRGEKYLDGMDCARASGITRESRIPPIPKPRIDRRYREVAEPVTDR